MSVKGRYKMKDLVEQSGLRRETIHFYISEGLLPPPVKKQRNMAWYGEEHLQRLRAILELQKQHFLPLKAIKSILNDSSDHAFTSEQRRLIAGLRTRFRQGEAEEEAGAGVPLIDLCERLGLRAAEVLEFGERGIIRVRGAGDGARLSAEDADLVAEWARLRTLGLTPERGFGPADVEVVNAAVEVLFDQEVKLFTERFTDLSEEEAWRLVERAVPALNRIFGIIHQKRIRRFVAEFGDEGAEAPEPQAAAKKGSQS